MLIQIHLMNFNLVSRIKALLTVIFSVSLLLIVGMGCEYSEETPEIEKRAQEINSVVMCPVCPGESIDQSQHPLAVQMRNIVVEELENGMNETQIKNYFVDAYGPSVLLEPPTSGINIWVWLVFCICCNFIVKTRTIFYNQWLILLLTSLSLRLKRS